MANGRYRNIKVLDTASWWFGSAKKYPQRWSPYSNIWSGILGRPFLSFQQALGNVPNQITNKADQTKAQLGGSKNGGPSYAPKYHTALIIGAQN